MTAYSEFRLRIDRGLSAGTYRVVATGPSGEALGRFKLPFSDIELENFVLKVGRTRRGKRRVESPEMELAKDFGGRLFSSLFDGDVKELFRSSFADARTENRGLRITLSLTGAPELSQVPWEYLYDHPSFMSISTWTPIVRYLDLPKAKRPLQIALPLRIIGVVSAPSDAEPIDVASEKAKLGQALAPLIQSGAVAIDWLETPTLRALQRQLRQADYHVLHYIGHGGYDHDADDGVVLFEDDHGRSRRITGVQLGTILQDEVSLRLAVLNACEGGRSSMEDPFSGVATSLIEREIPAVIGMQFEITDRSAIVFASEFYAALADGYPVDSAMAEARKAIYADENDVEWATPVLFMRVQDGLLFEVPAHAPAREQKPDPTVAVAAAKAEADAVKAGADPETAAAAATAAALATTPAAASADAPSEPNRHRTRRAAFARAGRSGSRRRAGGGAAEAEAAAAAERERLRVELDEARERERRAVEERDRLAAETEAARLAEEERRRQDAEHAAEHERASAAEATRHEEETRQRTEAARPAPPRRPGSNTARPDLGRSGSAEGGAPPARGRAPRGARRNGRPGRPEDGRSGGRRGSGSHDGRHGRLAGERLVRAGRLVERVDDGLVEDGRGSHRRAVRDLRRHQDEGAAATRRLDGEAPGAEPHVRRGPRLPRRVRCSSAVSARSYFAEHELPCPRSLQAGSSSSTTYIVPLLGPRRRHDLHCRDRGACSSNSTCRRCGHPQGTSRSWLVVLVLGMTLGPLSFVVAVQRV